VPTDVLQLVGDGIVAALSTDVPGALGLAEGCVLGLRARRWPGDEELAVELEAAMGRRAWPALSPLGVDLEELSDMLEAGLGEDGACSTLRAVRYGLRRPSSTPRRLRKLIPTSTTRTAGST